MRIFETFSKTSLDDLPRKILGNAAFSKLLWKEISKKLGNG